MSSTYQTYLDYLASFAASHTMAVETERNVYPLFADIKKLIGHYENTISKFANVQNELIYFIDRIEFDDRDFDFYQELFLELRKVDEYLQELKSKQIPTSISNEVQSFIENIYTSASLYKLENIEEQVLSYHNRTAEVVRQEQYEKQRKANQTTTTIWLVGIVVVIILLIAKCSH